MHPLTVRRGSARCNGRFQQLDQRDYYQRVADDRKRAQKPFGTASQRVVRRRAPSELCQQRLERPHHAYFWPQLIGKQGSPSQRIKNRGYQSKGEDGETPPDARWVGVGREVRTEQPKPEEGPREQRRRFEVEVLDQLERDRRAEHGEGETEGDPLTARDTAGQ